MMFKGATKTWIQKHNRGREVSQSFLLREFVFYRPSAAVKEITPETGSDNQKRRKKKKKEKKGLSHGAAGAPLSFRVVTSKIKN